MSKDVTGITVNVCVQHLCSVVSFPLLEISCTPSSAAVLTSRAEALRMAL